MKLKGFLAYLTRKCVLALLHKHYSTATHRFVLRFIMTILFDELQHNFREDNRPTTIAFMVEEMLNASDMDPKGTMYTKLREISG